MISNDTLTREAASFKSDARKHFDSAVAGLIALAWPWRKENFRFEDIPSVYTDATAACVALSDRCADAAKRRLSAIIEDSLDYSDADAAWDYVYGDDSEERFDMAGSHLLELLALWIGVAAANGWTKGYTRVMVSRYLANPFLCPEWRGIPIDALSWGSGYAKDISGQIAVIGQTLIIRGARYAEWVDAQAKGAVYYVRRRGSNYDCPRCDETVGIPIPITVPFETYHARCCCYPEYFYEPMP